MQLEAKQLASKIIMQHMKGVKLKDANLTISGDFKVMVITESQSKVCNKIDFSKTINIINNAILLVDNSTYRHLGIKYIIIKDDKFLKTNHVLENTIIIFTILYIAMIIIGYFLAISFLKPIIAQRKKLDIFIKDTTHELNTPISAIVMSIDKDKNPSQKDLFRIKLSAKRISEIYSDLTYLVLDTKSKNKNLQEINLKSVLLEQLEYFELLAKQKHITLTYNLDTTMQKIEKEDFIRLSNNLILNSIKYTKPNGKIEIFLKNNQFIVNDSGIGIADKQQKDIFKRFHCATSNIGGFGIGLSIVKNICKKYNFNIELKSKQGVGTTFTIHL